MIFRSKKSYGGKLKGFAILAAATLCLTACDGSETGADTSDETFTFTLAAGALEDTPHSDVAYRYMDLVEERTEGRIEFERTTFEALCNMEEIVDCLRDGRADLGFTVTDYTPNVLPSLSVVSISFLSTDIQATTAALYDMHTNYEPAVQRLEENNLQYVTSWPVGTMLIGSQSPVENLDDLDGLRARAAGPVTQQTLESAGINVNAITAPETHEALQRGVIDSVAAALDFGVNYGAVEQLPYWVDTGLGQYTSIGMWWNKASYDSLPDDLREIVAEVTEEMNYGEEAIEAFNDSMDQVCESMVNSEDVEGFDRWDEASMQEWRDEAGASAEELWLEIVDGYGFPEAEEYLAEYKDAYEEHTGEDNPVDKGISCVDEWQEQHG